MNRFDCISPFDYRYYHAVFDNVQPYLSENALIEYMATVEVALVAGFAEEGICSPQVVEDVKEAATRISAEEVYAEEERLRHLGKALVNCLSKHVSETTKPFIHLTATSHDIICTAEAMRYREFTQKVMLPKLLELEKTLIHLALQEKATVQIGRTHGQHAVPLTFGFAMAEYVARLGERIHAVTKSALGLRGQCSGAVGAYNAASLVVKDPIAFEKNVLETLDLKPGHHSTQIVAPEFMLDYMHTIVSTFGVLANLADDMRHLQRTEIAEVGEYVAAEQVGSSTMPNKKNPVQFENVKSLYKAMMPRIVTVYLDQISEHQRDLTNSASSRFYAEVVATFYAAASRMAKTMQSLGMDRDAVKKNIEASKERIIAEPLYIMLAKRCCANAHEKIRQLVRKADAENKELLDLVFADTDLHQYTSTFTPEEKHLLSHPKEYIGKAVEMTENVCSKWQKEFGIA